MIRPHPAIVLEGPHLTDRHDFPGDEMEHYYIAMVTPLQVVPHESWHPQWLRPSTDRYRKG